MTCELLRSLALGLAFYLAVSDRITIPYRFLRFLLTFVIIFAAGSAALSLSAPVALNTVLWVVALGVAVLVFLIGLTIVVSLLRWLVSRRQLVWCAGVCLVLGIGPLLLFAGNEWLLRYFLPPLNVQALNIGERLRIATILSQVLLTPYFMVFWFAVPALLSSFYRPRFASSFLRLSDP